MTKKYLLAIMAAAGLLLAGLLWRNNPWQSGIAKLNRDCHHAKLEQGFRTVKIRRDLRLVNQRGSLTVACQLTLQAGVSLEIDRSVTTTDKLVR
jgi:hypothetical protein